MNLQCLAFYMIFRKNTLHRPDDCIYRIDAYSNAILELI